MSSAWDGKQGRKQLHGYQKKLVSERVGSPAASGMPATAGIPIKVGISRSRVTSNSRIVSITRQVSNSKDADSRKDISRSRTTAIERTSATGRDTGRSRDRAGWDLAERLERLTANAKVATVLGSIPASSGTVESEGRQMKQCCIKYLKILKSPRKKKSQQHVPLMSANGLKLDLSHISP